MKIFSRTKQIMLDMFGFSKIEGTSEGGTACGGIGPKQLLILQY